MIVAGGLAVMVLSAQDDLDTVRQAAEQGDATAQFNLGNMYASGRGVLEDDAEAVRWYRLAAEQGHADAQFNLGVKYDFGEGVPLDDAEAVKWYRLAADQGLANAQFNLGNMYNNGEGVLKDFAEAVRWYQLAADQGLADAQNNLGIRYANGEGVSRTLPKPCGGSTWLRNRVMPPHSTTSGSCTPMGTESLRTPCSRTCGPTSQAPTGTKRPGNNETTSKTT